MSPDSGQCRPTSSILKKTMIPGLQFFGWWSRFLSRWDAALLTVPGYDMSKRQVQHRNRIGPLVILLIRKLFDFRQIRRTVECSGSSALVESVILVFESIFSSSCRTVSEGDLCCPKAHAKFAGQNRRERFWNYGEFPIERPSAFNFI